MMSTVICVFLNNKMMIWRNTIVSVYICPVKYQGYEGAFKFPFHDFYPENLILKDVIYGLRLAIISFLFKWSLRGIAACTIILKIITLSQILTVSN